VKWEPRLTNSRRNGGDVDGGTVLSANASTVGESSLKVRSAAGYRERKRARKTKSVSVS